MSVIRLLVPIKLYTHFSKNTYFKLLLPNDLKKKFNVKEILIYDNIYLHRATDFTMPVSGRILFYYSFCNLSYFRTYFRKYYKRYPFIIHQKLKHQIYSRDPKLRKINVALHLFLQL